MFLIDRGSSLDCLQTGLFSLTIFANCSFGQRQLVAGNDKVGKTSVLSIISQHLRTNSFYFNFSFSILSFIYVFFSLVGGSRREFAYLRGLHSSLNKFFNFFVDNTINLSIYSQVTGPLFLTSFCLSLCGSGLSSIHIIDNLSNHAKLYRNFMLDLRRAPGREAYPGDIFYLHSNLLERFGQFRWFYNRVSLTSFPVSTLFNDDISSFITTNLISITDGQWVFSSVLKLKGLFPPFNSTLSVSRLGLGTLPFFLKRLFGFFKTPFSRFFSLSKKEKSVGLNRGESLLFIRSSLFNNFLFIQRVLSFSSNFIFLLLLIFIESLSFCSILSFDFLSNVDLLFSFFSCSLSSLLFY